MEREIHGYLLQDLIGKGGFGEVWRAYQSAVEREVAIKVITSKYANQPEFIRNFEMEARMVARLEHPFITPLFDYWREPQGAYLVMRLLRGGTLKQEMQQGAMPLIRVADILDNICSGLWTAHRNHVAHRDIKPANILMDDERRAYLSDFGLAIEVGEDHYENLVGTWLYMPPERIRSQPQTHTVDIYSIGLMTFQMITGEYPFDRTTMKRLSQAHLSQVLPPLQQFREDVPEALDSLLHRATAKDPEDRYEDIRQFAQRFRDIIQPTGTKADQTLILPKYEDIPNPYLGLRPFSEAESMRFFGRHTLIKRLLDRLVEDVAMNNFLALVGPSGSGKSSAIYAGLLPQLRAGALEGSESWYYASMIPGSQPFQNLVLALRSIAVNAVDDLTSELLEHTSVLTDLIPRLLDNPQTPMLLFIDQFEEVFTQVRNEATRQRFLDLITATITAKDNNIRIIITMRADFYDRPLRYDAFGKLIQNRTEVILPLDPTELKQAIVGPAESVGIAVESELIVEMISDVKAEPGALPLLQYTLRELFEMLQGKTTLTLDLYRESHGIRGALARRADEVYQGLSNDGQRIAEQVFLRLVTLGEGTEDTRRRTRYSELMAVSENPVEVEKVLNEFSKYRLLTFDRDPETREPTVEVAHEALIREWRRFQLWLDNSRDDLRLQRMIASEVADWKDNQQDTSYLLRGNRLAQFEHWASTTNVVIAPDEMEYIKASVEERKHEEQIEFDHQQKELQLAQRASQRLRLILLLLMVASVGGSVLLIEIIGQRDSAQTSLTSAYSAALATTAQQALADGDYGLALSFALEAVKFDNTSAVAHNTLFEIAYGSGIKMIIDPVRNARINDIAMSRDGSLIATVQGLTYWELYGQYLPEKERLRPTSSLFPAPADFSTIDYSELPPPIIDIFDSISGTHELTLEGHTAPITSIGFVPSDDWEIPPTQLYSASVLGEVYIWDLTTGEIVQQFELLPHGYNRLSITSDGRYLFASTGSEADYGADTAQFVLLDMETGTQINEYPLVHEGLWDSVISPDGDYVLSAHLDAIHVVWDIETGEIIEEIPLENSIERQSYQVSIGHDPTKAVTSMGGGAMYVWEIELEDGTDYELEAEEMTVSLDSVADVGVSGDGSRMVMLQPGGSFIDWDIDAEGLIDDPTERGIEFVSTAMDETGNLAVVGRADGSMLVWDLTNESPELIQAFDDIGTDLTATFLKSDDAENIQVLVLDGDFEYAERSSTTLSIWDVTSEEMIRDWDNTPHRYGPALVMVDATRQYALTADMPQQGEIPLRDSRPKMIWWDLSMDEPLTIIEPDFPIYDAAFLPSDSDEMRAITGGQGGVYIWDLKAGEGILAYAINSDVGVLQVELTPDLQYILATTEDGHLIQWDFETREIIREYDAQGQSQALAIYPSNHWVITSMNQNIVAVWDYESGELLHQLVAHEGNILSADFALLPEAEFPWMITTGIEGEVIYWDTVDFTVVGTDLFPMRVNKVEVASNPEIHLIVAGYGVLEIADVQSPPDSEIFDYIEKNRVVLPITLQDCILFTVDDLCEETGIIAQDAQGA